MTEKVLPYDRAIVPQERGWSCGPASTQVVLNGLGIYVTESDLITEIGTHQGGTDDISWIETRALDRRVPKAGYARSYIPDDPPTPAQKAKLWRDVVKSIDAGFGVVMNWVAPPSNYPRGVKGSTSPAYGGGTVYHYVACMGYDDSGSKALWIADSGFRPFGYWVSFDQAAGLISPKGYAYATISVDGGEIKPKLPKRDAYATAIIVEGRNARTSRDRFDHPVITDKGIAIALSTALVESNLVMYANATDPETLGLPHEALSSDHDSSGLFQQRPPWWGTAKDRMDPRRSAAMFYHALARLDYSSDDHSPGWYAQSVQQSAFPERYDQKYGEAQAILTRLGGTVLPIQPSDPDRYPSRSPYRNNNDPILNLMDAVLNLDAMAHSGLVVEPAALRGEVWAIEKVARLAAGQGPGAVLWWDPNTPDTWAVTKARFILDVIERTNPAALREYLATKGQTE